MLRLRGSLNMPKLLWVENLLDWYRTKQRTLPWRSISDSYLIWISEVMLQQTRVDTVIPYFDRFRHRFKTITQLSEADIQEVLKEWEGLGYYSRARNLHKAARIIVSEFGGKMPDSYEVLRNLPGFGDYTAAAVASIAFGQAVPALDGNALRVFTRYWGIEESVRQISVKEMIRKRLLPIIKPLKPGDFNQAVMELGALVCRPHKPDCCTCPVNNDCIANIKNLTDRIPIRLPQRAIPQYQYGAGVIWNDGKVIISRRDYDAMLGGLWGFPSSKVETEESVEDILAKTIRKRTGLKIKVLKPYGKIKHTYSHFKIVVCAFRCELSPEASVCANSIGIRNHLKWIRFADVAEFPFDKATLKLIELIKKSKNV